MGHVYKKNHVGRLREAQTPTSNPSNPTPGSTDNFWHQQNHQLECPNQTSLLGSARGTRRCFTAGKAICSCSQQPTDGMTSWPAWNTEACQKNVYILQGNTGNKQRTYIWSFSYMCRKGKKAILDWRKNSEFSIHSNCCFGAGIYQSLVRSFQSRPPSSQLWSAAAHLLPCHVEIGNSLAMKRS